MPRPGTSIARALAAILLALGATACATAPDAPDVLTQESERRENDLEYRQSLSHLLDAPTSAPAPTRPDELLVQLWRSDLPSPLSLVAIHCWFAAYFPTRGWRSWEISGGGEFIHDAGTSAVRFHETPRSWCCVGGDSTRLEHEWRGADAAALVRSLEASLVTYPHRHTYCAWPGPNSNTYIAWVLRDAGVAFDMDPKAIGKDFVEPFLVGAGLTTGLGVHVETPLVGVKLGLLDGFELHFFEATVGFALFPPSIKTPVGRFGPWADDGRQARDEVTVAVSEAGGKR